MKKYILLAFLLLGLFGTPKSFAQASEPYLGQIIPVAFNFAPLGWAQCNGQILSIAQNTALFSLLGTTYGGNGQTTFALPDLRGRMIVGLGQGAGTLNITQGEQAGTESTTLTVANLPSHAHPINANTGVGTTSDPSNNFLADTGVLDKEYATTSNTTMRATVETGLNQPINNMKPFAPVYYIIAIEGIFPPHN